MKNSATKKQYSRIEGILVCIIFNFLFLSGCSSGVGTENVIVTIDDPDSRFTSYHSDIEKTLRRSFLIIAENLIIKKGTSVEIDVIFILSDDNYERSRTTAGTSSNFTYLEKINDVNLYEQGLSTYLKNPENYTDVPHMRLEIGEIHLTDYYWFDPDPFSRTAEIPENRTDVVSTFLHEIVHALAYNGWLDSETGVSTSPNGTLSTYDRHVVKSGDFLYFTGSHAVAVYGGDVPLNVRNYKHFGNTNDGSTSYPGEDLAGKLMFGEFMGFGYRRYVTDIDLAIMKDCGVPVKGE